MSEHTLGEQLAGPYPAGGGTATLHRGGVVVEAPGVRLTAWFDLPTGRTPRHRRRGPGRHAVHRGRGGGDRRRLVRGHPARPRRTRPERTPRARPGRWRRVRRRRPRRVGGLRPGRAGCRAPPPTRTAAARAGAARRRGARRRRGCGAGRPARRLPPAFVERLRAGTRHGHPRGAADRLVRAPPHRGGARDGGGRAGQLERPVPWLRPVRQPAARAGRPGRRHRDRGLLRLHPRGRRRPGRWGQRRVPPTAGARPGARPRLPRRGTAAGPHLPHPRQPRLPPQRLPARVRPARVGRSARKGPRAGHQLRVARHPAAGRRGAHQPARPDVAGRARRQPGHRRPERAQPVVVGGGRDGRDRPRDVRVPEVPGRTGHLRRRARRPPARHGRQRAGHRGHRLARRRHRLQARPVR